MSISTPFIRQMAEMAGTRGLLIPRMGTLCSWYPLEEAKMPYRPLRGTVAKYGENITGYYASCIFVRLLPILPTGDAVGCVSVQSPTIQIQTLNDIRHSVEAVNLTACTSQFVGV